MRIFLNLSIIAIFSIGLDALANIKKIATEYENGNISAALHLSDHPSLRPVHYYLLSQNYLDPNKKNSFEDITEFLSAHPDWPQFNSLSLRAESLLTNNSSHIKILRWFAKNKPKTSKGYYYHYKAGIYHLKDQGALSKIIKSAWINASFSKNEAEAFFKKHKKILTSEDHAEKISELIWNAKIDEAKKYYYLVDDNYKKAFDAWIEINKNGAKKAEKLFHNVKGSYKYEPGLLYSYLKLHMKDSANDELIRLYKRIPSSGNRAQEWWKLRNYFARELFNEKQYLDAYEIVSKHNLSKTDKADFADAEWFAGWLALRYLKKPELALRHFEKIYDNCKSAISVSRSAYWMARSYKALGKKEQANKWFTSAAEYGYTFYGLLAQAELGKKNIGLETNIIPSASDYSSYKHNKYAKISEFLAHTGKKELLKIFAKEAFMSSKSSGEVKIIFDALAPKLDLHWRVEIAKLAQQAGTLLLLDAFPTPYKVNSDKQNKIFSYGIMRQESVFDQFAISSANALGLMQITPQTAKTLCKTIGIRYDQKKLTKNTEYNIKLGSYYLKTLMKQHDNSYILAAANYNAGPVVEKWKNKYGDPNYMKLYQVIDWVESVPYHETRNYIQRILENIQIYRLVLTKSNKLHITKDMLN